MARNLNKIPKLGNRLAEVSSNILSVTPLNDANIIDDASTIFNTLLGKKGQTTTIKSQFWNTYVNNVNIFENILHKIKLVDSGDFTELSDVNDETFDPKDKIEQYLKLHALLLSKLILKLNNKYVFNYVSGDINLILNWNFKQKYYGKDILTVTSLVTKNSLKNDNLLIGLVNKTVDEIIDNISNLISNLSDGITNYIYEINPISLFNNLTLLSDENYTFNSIIELNRVDNIVLDSNIKLLQKNKIEEVIDIINNINNN